LEKHSAIVIYRQGERTGEVRLDYNRTLILPRRESARREKEPHTDEEPDPP
jgi:hypothetical protein